METLELITICLTSFAAVLLLLSFLALVMRIIILIFPAKENNDSAVIAAITTAYNVHYPRTKIIKIGEQK